VKAGTAALATCLGTLRRQVKISSKQQGGFFHATCKEKKKKKKKKGGKKGKEEGKGMRAGVRRSIFHHRPRVRGWGLGACIDFPKRTWRGGGKRGKTMTLSDLSVSPSLLWCYRVVEKGGLQAERV